MAEKPTSDNILSPNGLSVPESFPYTEYESVYKTVSGKLSSHEFYEHFSGSWNAIAYRYCACLDHGNEFLNSLSKDGSSPPPQDRYAQERMLFNFFSSAFATFEALFYGMYSIGVFTAPPSFSLETEREQQRVSPSSTQRDFIEAFPEDEILVSFESLFDHSQYQAMREIRNILTHRTAPGRRMYVSLGNDDIPTAEWKLNDIPIDENIITVTTESLSDLLLMMLESLDSFVKKQHT